MLKSREPEIGEPGNLEERELLRVALYLLEPFRAMMGNIRHHARQNCLVLGGDEILPVQMPLHQLETIAQFVSEAEDGLSTGSWDRDRHEVAFALATKARTLEAQEEGVSA